MSPESMPELADALRTRGMRMTPQRQSVMAAVTQLVHATPDQVAEAVPEVDLTTVYRTLETLEDLGLLAHTHLGHGAASYRLAQDDHVHVVCHRCAAVVDAPAGLADALAQQLLAERGFRLDRSHFTVFGTCARCSVELADAERADAGLGDAGLGDDDRGDGDRGDGDHGHHTRAGEPHGHPHAHTDHSHDHQTGAPCD